MVLVVLRFLFILGPLFFQTAGADVGIKEVDPLEVLYKDLDSQLSMLRPTSKLKWEDVLSIYQKRFADIEVPRSCQAAKEFQQGFEDCLTQKLISLPDLICMKIATHISKGCDGSANRYKKIFQLLLPAGVDKKKTIEIALHFASKNDNQTDAFVKLFKGTFLAKYWDLDFRSSLATSLQVALHSRGNADRVATDFQEVMNTCLKQNNLQLTVKTCAPYALDLAKASYLWPQGLAEDFKKTLQFLEEQKELTTDLPTRLKMISQVLSQGPKALENFKSQYNYAISASMKLPAKTALELAFKVALNSLNSHQDWFDLQ